jgi:hypothetical protein
MRALAAILLSTTSFLASVDCYVLLTRSFISPARNLLQSQKLPIMSCLQRLTVNDDALTRPT